MYTSTPLVGDTKDLPRSILPRNINNFATSTDRKRQLSNLINQCLAPRTEVDDELERLVRHNEAKIQKRLSNVGSPNNSPQVLNEKEIHDHFQLCLEMFAENKINSKNAWNLRIIDYMRTVLYSKEMNKDFLQVAGIALDVSAKIYEIRLDDIHKEMLKLASNMARITTQPENNDEEGENDDQSENKEGAKKNEGPKKKKKRMFAGQKLTIAKDPNSLLRDVPKLESVFFQTRTNIEASAVDNLFTNKFPMNHSRYKYMFMSKEKAWLSYSNKDSNVNSETKYSCKIKELKNFEICASFVDFKIDEWDQDEEATLSAEKSTANVKINEEVVYDAQGIPIHELDGSIHDVFTNAGSCPYSGIFADNKNEYSLEEDGEAQGAVVTKRVVPIVDFKPGMNGLRADDYCYSNAIDLTGGMLITPIWTGPSHWKLKHVRRLPSRFSGQPEKQVNKATKKTKILPALIDFNTDTPPFDKTKSYKPKRTTIDSLKCTLPQVTMFDNSMYRSLMLKQVYIQIDDCTDEDNIEDSEVRSYSYENPNDSQYCSQVGANNGFDDNGDNDDQGQDIAVAPQQSFQGENLVAAPKLVPKTTIPYARRAKKIDMRKLKGAIWKSLVSTEANEMVPDENMYQREVPEKKFSEIFNELPLRMDDKMNQELSCPLAFVALLDLCNEQNLDLTGQPDLGDFTIKQVKTFQP